MNLTDIYRTFYPTVAEYTFFPSAHGTFPSINYLLDYKTNFNILKKTEMILSIFGPQWYESRNQ